MLRPRFPILLPTLRARPQASLAAGIVAGCALGPLKGVWIPLAALGALSAILSIRWRPPPAGRGTKPRS